MTRTQLINMLIIQNGYKSYLEIGTQRKANNFDKINCEVKFSVDPDTNSDADFIGTSDQFFKENTNEFDIIFIDGLHHSEQVIKDIVQAWNRLKEGGAIVLHDCNPIEEWQQIVPRQHKVWYGDVWRAFVGFRLVNDGINSYCLEDDCGCGVIHKGWDMLIPFTASKMKWAEFDQNRNKLLGLI